MRTLLIFFGVVTFVGVPARSASATPLTLQYDVTVTSLCDFVTGSCSNVNIGGLELTVTTDDNILRREHTLFGDQPVVSRAYFGPTTVAIDTSSLGFFPNPSEPDEVISARDSFTQDVDFPGTGNTSAIGTLIQDFLMESSQPPGEFYQVLTELGNSLDHAKDAVAVDPTSADVHASLMRDLRFFQQVVAGICVDNDPCVFDLRSYEARGTATFREQIAPVPEPATLSLLSLGLVAGAAARRLRRFRA
jgi:hypothetical protein